MKEKRFIFAILLTTLVISTCILPTFAAVPEGRSGVNFAQVEYGEVFVYIEHIRNDVKIGEWADNATWNNTVGGFTVALPTTQYFSQGDVVRVYVNVRPNYPLSGAGTYDNWLFEYMQIDRLYYADALLAFAGTEIIPLSNREITFFSHPTLTNSRVQEYVCDGTHALRVYADRNNASIDEFMIEGTVKQNVNTVQITLRGFSILQDNAIFQMQDSENQHTFVETFFTPFNDAWFNITENEQTAYNNGYNNGYKQGYAQANQNIYDDGYDDGASDVSGGVIQRWGAFLLTAVNGFLSFEIFPGFPLWGLLSVAIAIPFLIVFLRMFAGG